eukprot:6624812-Ditylum_brightwellii.AAC.1
MALGLLKEGKQVGSRQGMGICRWNHVIGWQGKVLVGVVGHEMFCGSVAGDGGVHRRIRGAAIRRKLVIGLVAGGGGGHRECWWWWWARDGTVRYRQERVGHWGKDRHVVVVVMCVAEGQMLGLAWER